MIFKSKNDFILILEFCPLQVTTVKLCIIMRNIYYLLLVQHLTVSVLIWLKKKQTSKCQTKIFLIEFVEVPLEFNIIF